MPRRRPKRGRLRLGCGSRVRPRPQGPNPVRARDVVRDRADDGRRFRMGCVPGERAREALAIRARRRLGSAEVLAGPTIGRGAPGRVRSGDGPRARRHRRRGVERRRGGRDGVRRAPARPGRTAASRASRRSSAASSPAARSSAPCARPGFRPRPGAGTATRWGRTRRSAGGLPRPSFASPAPQPGRPRHPSTGWPPCSPPTGMGTGPVIGVGQHNHSSSSRNS